LVYTTLANAAREGVRYAEVHGIDSSATVAQIQAVVKNYLGAAPMNTSGANLAINVSGNGGTIGSPVTVTVSYVYDPFMTYFPLSVNLGSTSQGVITF
jgi:Flp pilus assembly protein TadG